MTDADPQRLDEPDPPWWYGHPITAVPLMAVLSLGVAARFLEGDAKFRALAPFGLVIGLVCVATGVGLLRGTLPPPSGPRARLVSPIATIAIGAALVVGGLAAISQLADRDEPSTLTLALVLGFFALMTLSLVIAAYSQSARWPDKWRSPYVRMTPDDDHRTPPRPTTTPADDA